MDISQTHHTGPGPAEYRLPARGRNLDVATEYYDRGWSVIPLAGKRPALASWRKFQTERASRADLHEWFGSESLANIGVVTGQLSGLVVVDCDSLRDAEFWRQQFPETPLAVQTGGGGAHFYYRYPDGESIGNRTGLLSRRIDLRGEGGYVVAPPSRHPNGATYEWFLRGDKNLDNVPHFLREWLTDKEAEVRSRDLRRNVKHPGTYIRSIRAVSGKGGHSQTFRAVCVLRDAGLTPEEALCELMLWNETNASPLWSARELLHKVQSAYRTKSEG